MLRLAVPTRAETLERMADPLEQRGIVADHVPTARRVISLSEGRPGDPLDEAFDVGFVFPPRLMEGGVADARLAVPWVNDRNAVLRSRNTAESLVRLDRAGIGTPKTVAVSNPVDDGDLRAVFERFDPPVVVKPNSTTRGAGVTKVADLDSFLGVVDYLDLLHDYRATADRSFLVQEFMPDAHDYRAMVVDGTYVGAVERRLPDEAIATGRWKHNVHRGADPTGVELSDELRDLAERAARALELRWLGVDILVSGDRSVVTETNARPTIDEATKYEPGFYDRLATLVTEVAEGKV